VAHLNKQAFRILFMKPAGSLLKSRIKTFFQMKEKNTNKTKSGKAETNLSKKFLLCGKH